MIIDALKDSELAESLHPAFKMVFDYVKSHDLLHGELGRIELDGENVYINVVETEGKINRRRFWKRMMSMRIFSFRC